LILEREWIKIRPAISIRADPFNQCPMRFAATACGLHMKLSEQEKSEIRKSARDTEMRTGIQALAVVTGKSDTYPEIPWKGFSLGAALATLALMASFSIWPAWNRGSSLILGVCSLAAGLVLASACMFVPPVGRIFLGRLRAEEETKQYAESIFLARGLSRTKSRNSVLLLVSQYERRASLW